MAEIAWSKVGFESAPLYAIQKKNSIIRGIRDKVHSNKYSMRVKLMM